MTWRTLITCNEEIEANMWKGKLNDNGIEVLILDTNVNSLRYYAFALVPIRVQVKEVDFIKAKRLVIDRGEDGNLRSLEDLEALALEHPHPDDAFLEKCPSCGGNEISFFEDPDRGWVVRRFGKQLRRCVCGYEWK